MFSTRGGPSGLEKQYPSGIPASRYLHQLSHESRDTGRRLPKQVNKLILKRVYLHI